ncbi:MAG: protein arginine kinase [Verrucomicrobia bacterium]|nr:protein arginine kinase [Verrucomicrobiota bacterium]
MPESIPLQAFLSSPADASRRTGPHDRIVLTSRVRLARNLKSFAFPGWAKKAERLQLLDLIRQAVASLPPLQDGFAESMDVLSPLDKQILVERHLISREHAARNAGSGWLLSRDEVLSVMINEEDHLRMQVLLPGLQIRQAWETINQFDSSLEKLLDYAFSPEIGYLTACPTNVGTGIRVSAMLHLPGLVLAEHINQIIQAVNKLSFAVRGFYGEGTEALGNIFQVSNQMTLGEAEIEIVERLIKVLAQVIESEENARALLLEKQPAVVCNQIGRAYGILAHAHIIASKETMNQLSLLRLGLDLGMFPGLDRSLVDELFLVTQPGHLQQRCSEKLPADERDQRRADLLRERLSAVSRPVMPPRRSSSGPSLDKSASV